MLATCNLMGGPRALTFTFFDVAVILFVCNGLFLICIFERVCFLSEYVILELVAVIELFKYLGSNGNTYWDSTKVKSVFLHF